MNRFLMAAMAALLVSIPVSAAQPVDDGQSVPSSEPARYRVPLWDGPKAVLWDNGPVITSIGTGVGGADESIIDPTEITNGFGCQWASDIRLSDDFEVPAGQTWEIDKITLIGYQTEGGPPSTIVGAYIEIYDGEPEFATLVWGDLFTNLLSTTEFMNCYRVNQAGSGVNTDRPLMVQTCEFSSAISLSGGTYWIVWQMDGTEESGPWNPPITIDGQLDTGNALQYYTAAWSPISDSQSGEFKGLPFILEGNVVALENETWGAIKSLF